MRFYIVDEHIAASDRMLIGYFHYHHLAWQEFQKSPDRRLTEMELIDEKTYEPVHIWKHENPWGEE